MSTIQRLFLLAGSALCACGSSGGPANDSAARIVDGSAERASAPPILKPGVDSSIFLPKLVAGYHPTAEELATSGKSCTTDADCATSGGRVTFRCSRPYYGQAQCQGVFPPGDQIQPGVSPSCAYYDCPAEYECETEPESHSVTCLASQGGGRSDGGRHTGTP